ncbi:MAG: GMC family oxidoreductase N-terminal domain-containing protein [Acidimicrobiales bacterium]
MPGRQQLVEVGGAEHALTLPSPPDGRAVRAQVRTGGGARSGGGARTGDRGGRRFRRRSGGGPAGGRSGAGAAGGGRSRSRCGGHPAAIAGPSFFAACTDAYLWQGLDGRRTPSQAPCRYRGRVVGGCSAVNAMVGLWATPADHDAPGWPASLGWAATAARRAAIERRLPLWRPPLAAWSPVEQALAVAAQDAGHRWCDDHHAAGAAGIGIGPAALTVRDGRRVSVNEGYLEPMRPSGYLTVRGGAEVAAVLLDGRRARGVRLTDGTELAARRVVVAAGAINSPVLLLRSGVSVAGVGEGLGDHPSAPVTLVLRPAGRLEHPDRYVVNSLLRYSSGLVAGETMVWPTCRCSPSPPSGPAAGSGWRPRPQDAFVQSGTGLHRRRRCAGVGLPVARRRAGPVAACGDGVRRLVGLCRHPAMTAVTEAVVLNGSTGPPARCADRW